MRLWTSVAQKSVASCCCSTIMLLRMKGTLPPWSTQISSPIIISGGPRPLYPFAVIRLTGSVAYSSMKDRLDSISGGRNLLPPLTDELLRRLYARALKPNGFRIAAVIVIGFLPDGCHAYTLIQGRPSFEAEGSGQTTPPYHFIAPGGKALTSSLLRFSTF